MKIHHRQARILAHQKPQTVGQNKFFNDDIRRGLLRCGCLCLFLEGIQRCDCEPLGCKVLSGNSLHVGSCHPPESFKVLTRELWVAHR